MICSLRTHVDAYGLGLPQRGCLHQVPWTPSRETQCWTELCNTRTWRTGYTLSKNNHNSRTIFHTNKLFSMKITDIISIIYSIFSIIFSIINTFSCFKIKVV